MVLCAPLRWAPPKVYAWLAGNQYRQTITVPVGKETLGRIMNVLGQPIDEAGPINTDEYSAYSSACA